MVLRLKARESRSPPGLPAHSLRGPPIVVRALADVYVSGRVPATDVTGAGWSSPVARQAHNLKAAGSNPAPATKHSKHKTKARPVHPAGRHPFPQGTQTQAGWRKTTPRRTHPF